MDSEPYTASYSESYSQSYSDRHTSVPLPPVKPRRTNGPLRREQVYRDLRQRILMGEFPTRMRLAWTRASTSP